jgi:hypothetical protein
MAIVISRSLVCEILDEFSSAFELGMRCVDTGVNNIRAGTSSRSAVVNVVLDALIAMAQTTKPPRWSARLGDKLSGLCRGLEILGAVNMCLFILFNVCNLLPH